ncbi:hypothetical protein CYMTET_36035, partial [Cymbomonas tetramitiformis]
MPNAEFACSACPTGYSGDGRVCVDEDECLQTSNGGCDLNVACTNTEGGRLCGECPSGYLGSGYMRCVLASDCSASNGGCDPLTACTDTSSGIPECGSCPAGYDGDGASGCEDQDGCVLAAESGEAGCYPGVHCQDVAAPGSGYTCGMCPAGLEGDGVTCAENACFTSNGGCDPRVTCTNAPSELSGRVCGGCPAGYVDEHGDGTSCGEEDGCATQPCFPGVDCTDVPAPGVGATCGACPAGYVASAGAGDSAAACVDVDECAEANGGCDAVATCTNAPGGRACGDCPAGFMGSGEAGCRPITTCADGNGGCHVLTSCTDVSDGVECGECPAGYEGSGYTTCEDIDGCAHEPCFARVECTDVPAPGEGRACRRCPEGYKGDGEICHMCQLEMEIVSSTVVGGRVKRTYLNQVVAELRGFTDPECVPSSQTTFAWSGATSDGAVLALTEEENRASSLRLTFPKSTLSTHLSYSLRLDARVTASPEVQAASALSFYVEPQALVALLTPSEVTTGEDSLVVLDAGGSFDPDEEAGELIYEFRCTRADGTDNCRDHEGELHPATWHTPQIEIYLLGAPDPGLSYSFELVVRKGARESRAVGSVTLSTGPLPVPTIHSLPGKVNRNQKLTLHSAVESAAPESVTRQWSVAVSSGALEAVDLAEAAATSLTQADLVLKAQSLAAGAVYVFKLQVEDAVGVASSSISVAVNLAPAPGSVSVEPSAGTVLDTVFQVVARDWTDDEPPLWYQLKYEVVGHPEKAGMLNDFQPQSHASTIMAEQGDTEQGYAVHLTLQVRDALGAVASNTTRVLVRPADVADEAALTSYVDDKLEQAASQLSNG